MVANKHAICPLCRNETATFPYDGRRFYVFHTTSGRRTHLLADDAECEATGWLVEDDELVVVPKTRKTSGIAQPRREWHCANGNGCTRSAPCGDMCRDLPDAPPVRPKENT